METNCGKVALIFGCLWGSSRAAVIEDDLALFWCLFALRNFLWWESFFSSNFFWTKANSWSCCWVEEGWSLSDLRKADLCSLKAEWIKFWPCLEIYHWVHKDFILTVLRLWRLVIRVVCYSCEGYAPCGEYSKSDLIEIKSYNRV